MNSDVDGCTGNDVEPFSFGRGKANEVFIFEWELTGCHRVASIGFTVNAIAASIPLNGTDFSTGHIRKRLRPVHLHFIVAVGDLDLSYQRASRQDALSRSSPKVQDVCSSRQGAHGPAPTIQHAKLNRWEIREATGVHALSPCRFTLRSWCLSWDPRRRGGSSIRSWRGSLGSHSSRSSVYWGRSNGSVCSQRAEDSSKS